MGRSTRLNQADDDLSRKYPPSTVISTMSTRSDTRFDGFYNEEIRPTLAILVTLGAFGLLCQALPPLVTGFLSVCLLLLTYKWFHLHGLKLTRKEILFFDESNLLQVNYCCDFAVRDDDCCTPGRADYKPEGPSTIWEALFSDEKELNLQKFYREHYGPVYKNSMRNSKMREEIQKHKIEENSTQNVSNR